MQEAQAGGEVGELETLAQFLRQRVGECARRRAAFQRAQDQPPQRALRQPGGGRIDGRQAVRQRLVVAHDMEARMDDLGAEEAAAHFAEDAQPGARREHLLLARVEVEEAQHQLAAGVHDTHDQLPARAEGHFG